MNETVVYPDWFYRGGAEMNLDMNSHNIYVKFKNKSGEVELTIQKNDQPSHKKNHQLKWKVWWVKKSDYSLREGYDLWTDYDLKLAFDLISGRSAKNTADVSGKFYRKGRCLNIPGMGTGQDGDANVSILVTSEIKKAIQEILMGG